ncbi:MAG: exodeoxyribonuclease III [Bdellovibrionales bacterium]
MSIKIASWNVNSIKARKDHVIKYLQDTNLDILMVQELKGLDFPELDFHAIGYETAAVTQKAYNGVAVFSKKPINVILNRLPGDETDEQSRYIEFETDGPDGKPLRLINIYLPNGNPVGTEKFTYKISWMKRLRQRLKELKDNNIPFTIGGDFNIIPEDIDCHNPKAWANDALKQPESIAEFRALLNLGLTEAYRIFDKSPERYSFWDYQRGAWQKNDGIRIDHFLLSPEIADRIQSCTIDKTPRGWERPSDHTPIIIEIAA